jgi:hypothetical protein
LEFFSLFISYFLAFDKIKATVLRFNELFHILLTAAAETHRQKMAASFDQRVVVGEEMSSLGNNDFNSSNNSMSTPRKPGRDLQHQYQGKSREVITSLLRLKI